MSRLRTRTHQPLTGSEPFGSPRNRSLPYGENARVCSVRASSFRRLCSPRPPRWRRVNTDAGPSSRRQASLEFDHSQHPPGTPRAHAVW